MTMQPTASPDQKKPLVAWLRDVLRPQSDADYFLRLARTVDMSAPVACSGCA